MFANNSRASVQDLQVNTNSVGDTPSFENVREVGYFSVDNRRNIHFDRSEMKYYVPKSNVGLALDLNANYWRTAQKIFDISEKMEFMQRWIMHQNFDVVDNRKGAATDFVTTRGSLQQVMCSPFYHQPRDSWSICACRLHNTIYFESVETDHGHMENVNLSEKERLMTAWGYKFEQYMTANSPNGSPDLMSVTYQLEDFSIVLQSKLNNHSLLYKAEVDGFKSGAPLGVTSSYIELKTSRNSPPYYSDPIFLRSKSLKWWAQIFLAGIREIVCGFRDQNGIVTSIETFTEEALPGYGRDSWTPDICLKFCDSFLTLLKQTVIESDHRVTYKFDFTGGSSVSCQKLSCPEMRFQVISDWYASALNQRLGS